MEEIPLFVSGDAPLPAYASEEAAGADLRADLRESYTLQPGARALIPTGLRFEIPPGFEVQVRPRSGLAYKHGVTLVNTPGTIDSDYRGEISVLLINHGQDPYVIEPGERLAQAVLAPVIRAKFVRKEELTTTQRNQGGWGHTGRH